MTSSAILHRPSPATSAVRNPSLRLPRHFDQAQLFSGILVFVFPERDTDKEMPDVIVQEDMQYQEFVPLKRERNVKQLMLGSPNKGRGPGDQFNAQTRST
ncbi:hypothetical protein H6P81_000950 [Aristolochia fimbriata]|uniref:Uncharacterized protein n=1 Tax=Aristolochia fimbriata TaxID=158543 RepID=A0AAV7F5P0_ARIFI|nr:hypothetical protein H6P81_000950 [Aristolochia fimbriata]